MADFVGAQYTIDEIKSDLSSKFQTTDGYLTDATNGLSAIKGAVNSANTALGDSTNGLTAIKSEIVTANGYLADNTYGLSAIKTAVNSANTALSDSTNGLSAIKNAINTANTNINTANSYLTNGTYGLSAIKNAISNTGVGPGTKDAKIVFAQGLGSISTSFTPIVNVSGKGKLFFASTLVFYLGQNAWLRFRITVDNSVILDVNFSNSINSTLRAALITGNSYVRNMYNLYNPGSYGIPDVITDVISFSPITQQIYLSDSNRTVVPGTSVDFVPFTSSLKIELAHQYAMNGGYFIEYTLD